MTSKFGSSDITTYKLGANQVDKIYLGSDLVFEDAVGLPEFVSNKETSIDSVNTVEISIPAGTQSGEVMIAYIILDGTPDVSMPGWNKHIQTQTEFVSSGLRISVFYRVSNGSEPATYTASWPTSNFERGVGHVWVYRNVNSRPIFDFISKSESTTSFSPDTLVTSATYVDAVVVGCNIEKDEIITSPGGFEEEITYNIADTPGTVSASTASNISPGGAFVPGFWTKSGSGENWESLTLSLAPVGVYSNLMEITPIDFVSSCGINVFSSSDFSIDWGDGNLITYAAGSPASVSAVPRGDILIKNNGDITQVQFTTDTYNYISILDGNTLTSFNSMCLNLTNLVSLNINENIYMRITDVNAAFMNCSSLIQIKAFDTSAITAFTDTWNGCSGLTGTITVYDLVGTSLATSLIRTWNGCSGITAFNLQDNGLITDFTDTWNGCSGITAFRATGALFAAGLDFTRTWQDCSSLTELLDGINYDFSTGTNFTNTWSGCNLLESFPSTDFSAGTTFVETWESCTTLISFNALNVAAGTNFSGAWKNCSGLTYMPAITTTGATLFDSTFENCTSLTCLNTLDTLSQTSTTNLFNNTPALAAPDGTEQTALLGGSSYTNPGECPVSSGGGIIYVTQSDSFITDNLSVIHATIPSGVSVGDLLVLSIAVDGDVSTSLAAEPGWIETHPPQTDLLNAATLGVFHRVVDGSEVSTVYVQWTGTERCNANVSHFTGVNNLTPYVQSAYVDTTGGGGVINIPALSSLALGNLIYATCGINRANGTFPITNWPSNTANISIDNSTSAGQALNGVAYKIADSSNHATDYFTLAGAGKDAMGIIVEFKAA
ncbi:MAG: hypothetical protein DRQ56_04220 [Gammaproteobacteria bacterium]|nr:MAG: hypothetical protein DRQ56_04220 [Gammaproteobacteria bacterium]